MGWLALLTRFHPPPPAGLAGPLPAARQSSAMPPRGRFPPAKRLPLLQRCGMVMLEQKDAGSCTQRWL